MGKRTFKVAKSAVNLVAAQFEPVIFKRYSVKLGEDYDTAWFYVATYRTRHNIIRSERLKEFHKCVGESMAGYRGSIFDVQRNFTRVAKECSARIPKR